MYLRPPRISCTASFYIQISTVIIPFILTVHKPNSLNFIRLRNYCVTRRGGGPRLYEFISLGKQLTGHFRYCTFEQPKNRRKLLIKIKLRYERVNYNVRFMNTSSQHREIERL